MSTQTFQFTYADGGNANKPSKVLNKTEDGWYICNLGALNAFNSKGQFYLTDNAQELFFGKESLLNRKLGKGLLMGEIGHPQVTPGMSKIDFYMRNLRIDEPRVSHYIRNIQFKQMDYYDSFNGQTAPYKLIQVVGEVKPAGPYASALENVFNIPGANVAFSIRSFTQDSMENGLMVKRLTNVVTYDWVAEPGIASATKFATESYDGYIPQTITFTEKDIELIHKEISNYGGMSHESSSLVNDSEILLGQIDNKKSYHALNTWGGF